MNTTYEKRALDELLFQRFKSSDLVSLTKLVRHHPHLMLNFRGESATIYYKNLRLLKVKKDGSFIITGKYVEDICQAGKIKHNALESKKTFDVSDTNIADVFGFSYSGGLQDSKLEVPDASTFPWERFVMQMMFCIDHWRALHKEQCEKEIQQRIAMENNTFGDASATDYFIIDTEYAEQGKKSDSNRFDAIALKWSRSMRKGNDAEKYHPVLALLEVKVHQKALDGDSGIVDHLTKVQDFTITEEIYKDLEKMLQQMRELGLINISTEHKLTFNREAVPEFIFVIANYNQKSTKLWEVLTKISEPQNYNLRFATSSFVGYGLYEEGILTLSQFKSLMPLKMKNKLASASEKTE